MAHPRPTARTVALAYRSRSRERRRRDWCWMSLQPAGVAGVRPSQIWQDRRQGNPGWARSESSQRLATTGRVASRCDSGTRPRAVALQPPERRNQPGPALPGVHRSWRSQEREAPVLPFRREPSVAEPAHLGVVHANRRRVRVYTVGVEFRRDAQRTANRVEAGSLSGKGLPRGSANQPDGLQPCPAPRARRHSLVQIVTAT